MKCTTPSTTLQNFVPAGGSPAAPTSEHMQGDTTVGATPTSEQSRIQGCATVGARTSRPPETSASPDLGHKLKQLFPAFSEAPDVVFFDNASTTQKPAAVIEAIEKFYRQQCANAGRALYPQSLRAAQSIEQAREDVAGFINARPYEIVFTAGATDSLNTVAWSWGLANLVDGDEVLVCLQDHSSAVAPWQNLQAALASVGKNITLVPFEIHPVGDYSFSSIKRSLGKRTRLIALSHVHHVFGVDMEVNDIRQIVGPDVIISLDAAQSVGHRPVDAKALDVDFLSFSGHKMFAGNGIGVLYARASRHNELIPFRGGGQMAPVVTTVDAEDRGKFIGKVESGTPNIPSIASLSTAIQFINDVGLANIEQYVSSLTDLLVKEISNIPGIIFGPGPVLCGCPGGFGILSFRFEQASSMDIASALANEQIHVRSGMHCRADKANSEDLIRVSMHAYNTAEDVEILTQTLREIVA